MRSRTGRAVVAVALGIGATLFTVTYGWFDSRPEAKRARSTGVVQGVTAGPDKREWGWEYLPYRWYAVGDADVEEAAIRREIGFGIDGVMPRWLRLPEAFAEASAEERRYTEWWYGWPFRCARAASFVAYQPTRVRITAGVELPGQSQLFPTEPVWTGLMANIGLGAAVVFLPWEGLTIILARQRVRKGRCAHCGYLRQGIAPSTPCPECGWFPRQPPHATPSVTRGHSRTTVKTRP